MGPRGPQGPAGKDGKDGKDVDESVVEQFAQTINTNTVHRLDENIHWEEKELVDLIRANAPSTTFVGGGGGGGATLNKHFTVTIGSDGVSWDDEVLPLFRAPLPKIHVTKVIASVIGSSTPTLTFSLEARSNTNSAGTQICQMTATDTDASATIASAKVSDEKYICFTTGSSAESGTVDSITITVYYQVQ